MRLTEIETFVVGNPPPTRGGRYFLFCRLKTDDGVHGVGEAYVATFGPHLVARMLEDVFARWFEGQDPHRIETLSRRTYGSGYAGRPDITLMGVFSALEMACWDIIGKAAGKPCYELLGGKVWDRLRAYTYLYPPNADAYADDPVYRDADAAAEQAAREVAAGFTAVKFDPAGAYGVFDGRQPDLVSIERSVAFVKKIREAVGTKADLLFGTHGQFTPSGAIRLAKKLEFADPLWFEEPTPPEQPEQMAKVARATSIPIATGERLTMKHEYAAVLAAGAASILQPDLGRSGGLLEGKKIAAIAEAHHAQIAPHLYCGPIVWAANIQLAACTPNFLVLESIRENEGFHGALIGNAIRVEDGHVTPPTAPGLGVDLDVALARAHPYTGTSLHLRPTEHPLS